MALSNLFGWTKKMESTEAAACGTACGAGNKPEGSNRPVDDCSERTEAERRQPVACGSACGAGDKPDEKPAACGSACGAGDK